MRWLIQTLALIQFNLQTLPARRGSATAAVFGIAGVVAVFVGVLSIGEGFRRTMTMAGSDDTVMVMRTGADSEMTSIVSRDEANIIAQSPGLATGADGKPLVSPELFVIVTLPKRSTNTDANVPLRGVERGAFGVRDEVKITEGRAFEWGRNEVIVGRAAMLQFAGLGLGSELQFGQNKWKVVGIFDADGALVESEIWADAGVLAPAYRRGSTYQVVLGKLASAGNFQRLEDALTSDPRLNVKVMREIDYYAAQSQTLVRIITFLAGIITILMGLAAVFGALNTMYTAVAARSREIATLEAIGFGGAPVVLSVLFESVVLAIAGGALGALGAWIAFDGFRAATLNWQTFSQVAFSFDVSLRLLTEGIIAAVVIGLIGGLFPALRAARMPVATALRER